MERESKAAVFLTLGSFAIIAALGYQKSGVKGTYLLPALALVEVSIQVGLGLIACWIITKLMRVSFGTVRAAILKLTAVMSVTFAAFFAMPTELGALLMLVAYFAMLRLLFDLKWIQVIAFTAALILLRLISTPAIRNLTAAIFGEN